MLYMGMILKCASLIISATHVHAIAIFDLAAVAERLKGASLKTRMRDRTAHQNCVYRGERHDNQTKQAACKIKA